MRRRLVLSYLALTLVVLAVLEIPLAVNYRERVEGELIAGLTRDAFAMASLAEDTMEGQTGRTIDLQVMAGAYAARTGARVVIVDRDGAALADTDPGSPDTNFANRPEVAAALEGEVSSGRRRSNTLGTDLVYVAVPVASGDVYGAIRINYSTGQINERVRRYWLTLAGVAGVSLAAAGVIGVLLARWVTRPLDDLRDGAERLGAGELDARVPVDAGPPEVRGVASSFNAMAARLDQLVESQEAFVADASHQLRTPLTALRLRLENLEEELAAGHLDDDARAAASADTAAALAETQRLSRLVDGLLTLARADRADPGASARPVPVEELFVERVDVWLPLAEERRVTLAADAGGCVVRATPDRVAQALDNLLANALDVAPSDSTIHLVARDGDTEQVEIHVIDHGPGLPPEQRARAFDRFWRGTTTRGGLGGSGLGGSGLGLAIVERLAVADGGTAELRAADTGGIDAVLVLPRGELR